MAIGPGVSRPTQATKRRSLARGGARTRRTDALPEDLRNLLALHDADARDACTGPIRNGRPRRIPRATGDGSRGSARPTRHSARDPDEGVLATQLPVIPLYQVPIALVHRSDLLGMRANPGVAGPVWNIEDWHWRS
jgi:hypothetical protein